MNRYFLQLVVALLFCNVTASAKNFKGAEIFSNESVKYGRFDMRMKTIFGSGCLSTFFLYYNESHLGGAEPWREIDLEIFGQSHDSLQTNIITGNAASRKTSEGVHKIAGASLDESFHTYSIEWTPDYIAWLVDGVQIRKSSGQQIKECTEKMQSFRFNAWIANIESWVGTFDSAILPVYQYVNWITYSEYVQGQGDNGSDFKLKWRDDFNTFDDNRWGKASWTFNENLVDFIPQNVVLKEGYLILCVTSATKTGFNGTLLKDLSDSVSIVKSDFKKNVTNLTGSKYKGVLKINSHSLTVSGAVYHNLLGKTLYNNNIIGSGNANLLLLMKTSVE